MRLWLVALVAVMGFGLVSAQAVFFTLTPDLGTSGSSRPPDDLGGLDHHNAYMWRLSGLPNVNYTSAVLTISNITNWDTNPNTLFVHLFDTAKYYYGSSDYTLGYASATHDGYYLSSRVTTYEDSPSDSLISDAFAGSNWWVNNPLEADDPVNRTNVLLGTFVDTNGVDATNTVTFDLATIIVDGNGKTALEALNEYINSGSSDIAFALDPDCHFFNSGITFTLSDKVKAIPEGSVVLPLLGILALVGGRQYLRRRPVAEMQV